MESNNKQVLLLLAAVACLASQASAAQWVVGWKKGFNQTAGWAKGTTFAVGDTLKFVYPKDQHTVVQVGEDDFAACNLNGNKLGSWCSGNDVVTLDKPGKAWFICTVSDHCLDGMKLAVDVVDLTGVAAPTPSTLPFPFPGSPPALSPSTGWTLPRGSPTPAPITAPGPAATPSPPMTPFWPFPWGSPTPAPVTAPGPATAPSPPMTPFWPFPWGSPGPAPGPAPGSLTADEPSSAVVARKPVGGAVAAAAAAVVVVAALTF